MKASELIQIDNFPVFNYRIDKTGGGIHGEPFTLANIDAHITKSGDICIPVKKD